MRAWSALVAWPCRKRSSIALYTTCLLYTSVWAWILLALTFFARLAVAFTAAALVLGDPQFFHDLVLLPLRDLIAPIVWAASFMGSRIHWRGDVFELKDGRLIAVK